MKRWIWVFAATVAACTSVALTSSTAGAGDTQTLDRAGESVGSSVRHVGDTVTTGVCNVAPTC